MKVFDLSASITLNIKSFQDGIAKAQESAQKAASTIVKMGDAASSAESGLGNVAEASEKMHQGLQTAQKAAQKAEEGLEKAADAAEEVVKSSEKLQEGARKTEDYARGTEKLKTGAEKASKAVTELSETAKKPVKLDADTNSLLSKIKSVSSKILGIGKNTSDSLGSTIMKTVGTVVSINAAKNLVQTGIDYNRTIEDYTANMTTLLGGADKAEAKIAELSKMAAETPFELSHLADATQTLLAFGVDSEKSTKVLKSLGDISLGNSSKLETLTRAYGKMSSTGKVTLENVQMMIDAGFNPLNLIAERNNMTMEDLYKAISDGKVPFSELEWAIQKATSAGGQFYNGMETASKTMSGRLATLSDNWSAFLGLVTKPAYNALKDTVLPYAIDLIDKLTESFQADGISGAFDTFATEVGKLGSSVASKVLAYFDSDQAVTDLQSVTGKIAQLLTSGNVVLSDVLGFAGDVVDKIADNFDDQTVKDNLAKIGEQLVKGVVTLSSENVERTIKAASITLDICTALITGIGNYFATADLSTIVSSLASGIIDLGISAIQSLPAIVDAALKIAHGLVNGVASALPDVGQSILDGFAALFSPSEQDALTEKLNTMREALDSLDTAVATAQSDYGNTMSKIESRASLASQYLTTIEELEKKDQLTDQDYENWQNAVTALTNMYPELKELVDSETGLFTANTAEIRDNINALNELAKTKAMSNVLEALSESAAGYVENMVTANATLLEIKQNAADTEASLAKFNQYFGSQPGAQPGDGVTLATATTEGMEQLTANQTKLLEATEAGKQMLEEFYTVAQDGTATLTAEYADDQQLAMALQNQIAEVKAELEAQQAALEAQKAESEAQLEEAQAQLDAVNAEKDEIMAAYDDLFVRVADNMEKSGTTAEELGDLYVKQQASANAAALDVQELVDKWNSVPESKKTTYTIETIETGTSTPTYKQGQGSIGSLIPGHATGLYEVPYDGYAAILHRGERVLTKAQADESRSKKDSRSQNDNYTINIQSTAESPSETAMYIKQAMRSLRFGQ